MADKKVTQLPAAGTLDGTEVMLVSKLSATVTRTAATISALNADNSINDSANGFLTAGFAVGDQVRIQGFATGGNNILSATVTSAAAGKLIFGGVDGNVLVDEAAGASVTITKWDSRRALAQEVADLFTEVGLGNGDVVGPAASTDLTIVRFDGVTGKLVQASGIVVTDSDGMFGDKKVINRQTGTTYTLDASDSGKIVKLTNAAAITLTLPNTLPEGFYCTVVQGGAGAITFSPEAGGTLLHTGGFTSTSAAGTVVVLFVDTNTGTNAAYIARGLAV